MANTAGNLIWVGTESQRESFELYPKSNGEPLNEGESGESRVVRREFSCHYNVFLSE